MFYTNGGAAGALRGCHRRWARLDPDPGGCTTDFRAVVAKLGLVAVRPVAQSHGQERTELGTAYRGVEVSGPSAAISAALALASGRSNTQPPNPRCHNESIYLLFADQGPRIRPCPRMRISERKIGASGFSQSVVCIYCKK